MMKEKPRIVHNGFQIWLTKVGSGGWEASVEALPREGSAFTSGPGKDIVPNGPFTTEESAMEAARRYIDRKKK